MSSAARPLSQTGDPSWCPSRGRVAFNCWTVPKCKNAGDKVTLGGCGADYFDGETVVYRLKSPNGSFSEVTEIT